MLLNDVLSESEDYRANIQLGRATPHYPNIDSERLTEFPTAVHWKTGLESLATTISGRYSTKLLFLRIRKTSGVHGQNQSLG
jgi:hypothetical protein